MKTKLLTTSELISAILFAAVVITLIAVWVSTSFASFANHIQ